MIHPDKPQENVRMGVGLPLPLFFNELKPMPLHLFGAAAFL